MTAQEKLNYAFNNNKHICVGLDIDEQKIPDYIKKEKNPLLTFNKIIIDNTYNEAAAYKLNFAFYEKMGVKGLELLYETLNYIPNNILTLGDAKRGDIGNTSEMYAKAIYDELLFDSTTLNPYMGIDSVEPFLRYQDKISFILVLTSNKSAMDFEKLRTESGEYLYQKVLSKVNEWNKNNNCGIVFGATNLDELKSNINSFNGLYVLLPGVGAQGGSLEKVTELFRANNYKNYLINISRALIYCDNTPNFNNSIKKLIISYNKI